MSKPRILSTSLIAQSRLFRIEALEMGFAGGQKATFECLRNQGSGVVMVAALDGEDMILVREYAAGLDRYELGFVKGKIDPGESPEVTAARELAEEIGYAPARLEALRSVTTSPGYSDFVTYLFVARDLRREQLESGDEIEPLEQVRWPLARLSELYGHPEVSDARFLLLLHLIQNTLGNHR
jgi:ADP-ribose diphosphatase